MDLATVVALIYLLPRKDCAVQFVADRENYPLLASASAFRCLILV